MYFLSDVCEAEFALNKQQLYGVRRVFDKGVEKRLTKLGKPHKKLFNRYSQRELQKIPNLTRAETYSLLNYMDGGYNAMNKGENFMAKYLTAKTDKGLRKLPTDITPTKPLVRRIVVSDDDLQKTLSNYKTGKKVTAKKLTSTARQEKGVRQDLFGNAGENETQIKFLINPRKNTRSRYVEKYASRYDNEGEQLFPSRTGFKTTKVRETNKGYTINMDEI
jgi:hypothetical protein